LIEKGRPILFSQQPERILKIAKAQKSILWCILCNLICLFIPLFYLIVIPVQIYFVYQLAAALEVGVPILWAAGMLVPLLSLILLLILSQRATNEIRNAGFNVGLMGANLREIEERL
jgi:hypothetical protein